MLSSAFCSFFRREITIDLHRSTNALKNLKSLALPTSTGKQPTTVIKLPYSGKTHNIPDCCICTCFFLSTFEGYLIFNIIPTLGLFSVTIRQALFIAPCSHTFHYKCIRPLLESHHPAFSCPLCRTFADLDDDVEVEIEYEEEDADAEEHLSDGKDLPARGTHIDIDVDSPPSEDQEHGAHAHHHAHHPHDVPMDGESPASRSNSGLGVRCEREAGAETEVEEGGGAGLGLVARMRARRSAPPRPAGGSGSGDRASPLDLTDEQDEEMVDVGGAELGIVGSDGDVDAIDADGTVGGKRKR
jgi:hypothetical protein